MSEEKCLEIKGKMRSMDYNQCPRITVLIRILTPSIVNLFYPQIVNHYMHMGDVENITAKFSNQVSLFEK